MPKRKKTLPVQLPSDLKQLVPDELKEDARRAIKDDHLVKRKKYLQKYKRVNSNDKTYVICPKCRYPFKPSGYVQHYRACDGTGPKDNSFRGQAKARNYTHCPYCSIEMVWMNLRSVAAHMRECKKKQDIKKEP